MKSNPTPKKPRKKDDTYMRRAYLYTAILLVLGLVGGLLLATQIVTAQDKIEAEYEQEVEDDEPTHHESPEPNRN